MTYNLRKPCLRCGELFRGQGGLCPTHRVEYESKRATPERKEKKKALYGGDYRKRRQQALANATHCHICKQPFTAQDKIESDHLAPHPNSLLLASHRRCNQAKGNKVVGND